jgi:hypothetical protein
VAASALFTLVHLGLAIAACHAEVQIEILNADASLNVAAQGHALYVRPKGGAVKSLQVVVLQLKADDGTPLGVEALTFQTDARQLDADAIRAIPVRINPAALPRAGIYAGLAQVSALDVSGKAVKDAVWSFKCIRPVVDLKIGDGDTLRISVARRLPFTTVNASVPVGYRIIPAQSPPSISFDKSPLYRTVSAVKYLLPGSTVEARVLPVPQNSLEVSVTLPRSATNAVGTLRARSPDFKSDVETPIAIAAKDWSLWPLIVVFLGQVLSFRIARWVGKDRQALLNRATWQRIDTDLENLLAQRLDLASNPSRAAILELLQRARWQDDEGNVDGAKSSLAAAQTKLDELRAVPRPAAPPTGPSAPPPPRVEILDAPATRMVDRPLQFIISNPDPQWLPADNVQWTYSRDGGAPVPLATTRERQAVYSFNMQGAYQLAAKVGNQAVTPVAFQVLPAPKHPLLAWIASVDNAISLLAVFIAAALSYIAIDKLESFGTVSDYILSFVGGFGINETLKGFGPVLAKLRGG